MTRLTRHLKNGLIEHVQLQADAARALRATVAFAVPLGDRPPGEPFHTRRGGANSQPSRKPGAGGRAGRGRFRPVRIASGNRESRSEPCGPAPSRRQRSGGHRLPVPPDLGSARQNHRRDLRHDPGPGDDHLSRRHPRPEGRRAEFFAGGAPAAAAWTSGGAPKTRPRWHKGWCCGWSAADTAALRPDRPTGLARKGVTAELLPSPRLDSRSFA